MFLTRGKGFEPPFPASKAGDVPDFVYPRQYLRLQLNKKYRDVRGMLVFVSKTNAKKPRVRASSFAVDSLQS